MELVRDFIKEYLIKQHRIDEKEHIKYKSVKIMLKCIGGKYSINEKRKSNLFGAIMQNELWISYVEYSISVSGKYFSDIKELLYMLKCNPIKIYETIESIFRNIYFHDFIDKSKIDISKNLSQRHMLLYLEKNNILVNFFEYIIKNIEIFLSKKDKLETKIELLNESLRKNNIFNYQQRPTFNNQMTLFSIGQRSCCNYNINSEYSKKKRNELLKKRRLTGLT